MLDSERKGELPCMPSWLCPAHWPMHQEAIRQEDPSKGDSRGLGCPETEDTASGVRSFLFQNI